MLTLSVIGGFAYTQEASGTNPKNMLMIIREVG